MRYSPPKRVPIEYHRLSKGRSFAALYSSGANRDRTGDLLLAKQALSQLSYGPARSSLGEHRGHEQSSIRTGGPPARLLERKALLPGDLLGDRTVIRCRLLPLKRLLF